MVIKKLLHVKSSAGDAPLAKPPRNKAKKTTIVEVAQNQASRCKDCGDRGVRTKRAGARIAVTALYAPASQRPAPHEKARRNPLVRIRFTLSPPHLSEARAHSALRPYAHHRESAAGTNAFRSDCCASERQAQCVAFHDDVGRCRRPSGLYIVVEPAATPTCENRRGHCPDDDLICQCSPLPARV